MNRHTPWILALLIGFAIGYYTEMKLKTNDITLVVRNNGALLVHPNAGDTVHWLDEQLGNTIRVKFDRTPPCSDKVDSDNMLKNCTVNVSAGVYGYGCENDKCVDPGIGVGGDVLILGTAAQAVKLTAHLPTPDTQTVFCDANKAGGPAVTATKSNILEWVVGDGSPGNQWTVTLPNGTCQQGDAPLKAGQICTVIAGPTAAAPYQITGTSCSAAANGQGTLTIQ
ncbi:MAG: hypothetical protein ACLQU1_35215 [Bryobacteraceae bacterium]